MTDGLVVSDYADYDPDDASIISLEINNTLPNWGTTGGASITWSTGTWWNGVSVPKARFFPPTSESASGLGNIPLWKGAAKNVKQINIRLEYAVSAAYCADSVGHPKFMIVNVSDVLDSVTGSLSAHRPMLFLENMNSPPGTFTEQANSLFLVLSQGTTRMFSTTNLVPGPSSTDWVSDSPGPTTNPILQPFYHRATSGTDSNGAPFIPASEVVCVEMRINVNSTTDEPNGVIAYRLYRRNGEVYERACAWDWEEGHTPGSGHIAQIDCVGGGYYNNGNDSSSGLYTEMGRYLTLGFNMSPTVGRAWIGPPDGFTDEDPDPDTVPNAFSFTDQTGVALSSTITSASITVSGIDAAATITVTGGTYDINGSGTFVSTSGTVDNGDTVRARHTSSASYSTATNTVVTIGGVSDTFTSTTEADPGEDTTPDAFTFTDQTDVALSTVITSAAITVAGIDAPATISVSGGTYDINGSGAFVSTPGTVEVGDTVRARHTSSASNSTATNTVVTIGGVSDTFTSTTEAAEPGEDTTPNAFSFTDQTNVARSMVITSAAITVSGIDAPTAISVSGGTYDINGSGTFTSDPGTVNNGDTVRARHTSSASYETATNTVVTIGGVSDTFTSTTEESEIIIPAHRWFRVPRR